MKRHWALAGAVAATLSCGTAHPDDVPSSKGPLPKCGSAEVCLPDFSPETLDKCSAEIDHLTTTYRSCLGMILDVLPLKSNFPLNNDLMPGIVADATIARCEGVIDAYRPRLRSQCINLMPNAIDTMMEKARSDFRSWIIDHIKNTNQK